MTEKNIYTALLAAQKEMGKLLKNATNPHFRNKYADLSAVIETVAEPLQNNGIGWFQPIETWTDGVATVNTVLVHADSGTKIESKVPIVSKDPNNPQAMGAAITYARRYGLMAMCGLAPEDDDGNAAASHRSVSGNGNVSRDTVQNARRTTETRFSSDEDSGQRPPAQWVPDASDRSAAGEAQPRTNPNGPSAAQIRRFHAMRNQLGISEEEADADLNDKYGVDSVADLDWRQYKDYTEEWDTRIKAKAGNRR